MIESFIAALSEALEMDPTEIDSNSRFRDFENYSSLSELSVLAMLDSEFGIEIEMKEFNKYITVGDLMQLVKTNSIK